MRWTFAKKDRRHELVWTEWFAWYPVSIWVDHPTDPDAPLSRVVIWRETVMRRKNYLHSMYYYDFVNPQRLGKTDEQEYDEKVETYDAEQRRKYPELYAI